MKLKPGNYILSDPAYLIPDKEWSNYLDKYDYFSEQECEDFKHKWFACGTAYGDGYYPVFKDDKLIGRCGVDAGLISIVPLALVKRWKADYKDMLKRELIVEIKLEKETEVKYRNGVFMFGPFIIDTLGEIEERLLEDEECPHCGCKCNC